MQVFDEITLEEVQFPDLSVGYLYDGLSPDFGTGREPCQYYHKYEKDETAVQQSKKTIDQKITDAVTAAVALAQGGM